MFPKIGIDWGWFFINPEVNDKQRETEAVKEEWRGEVHITVRLAVRKRETVINRVINKRPTLVAKVDKNAGSWREGGVIEKGKEEKKRGERGISIRGARGGIGFGWGGAQMGLTHIQRGVVMNCEIPVSWDKQGYLHCSCQWFNTYAAPPFSPLHAHTHSHISYPAWWFCHK